MENTGLKLNWDLRTRPWDKRDKALRLKGQDPETKETRHILRFVPKPSAWQPGIFEAITAKCLQYLSAKHSSGGGGCDDDYCLNSEFLKIIHMKLFCQKITASSVIIIIIIIGQVR